MGQTSEEKIKYLKESIKADAAEINEVLMANSYESILDIEFSSIVRKESQFDEVINVVEQMRMFGEKLFSESYKIKPNTRPNIPSIVGSSYQEIEEKIKGLNWKRTSMTSMIINLRVCFQLIEQLKEMVEQIFDNPSIDEEAEEYSPDSSIRSSAEVSSDSQDSEL